MSQKGKKIFESMDSEDSAPSSNIIRIDVLSLNGKNFDHKFSGEDVKDLWERALKRDKSEVIGQSSNKISKTTLRVNVQLNKTVTIKEVSPTVEFAYEKITTFQNYHYECKIVGLGTIKEAEIGDIVTVTIKRGHFRFTVEEAADWMSKFGKITKAPRFTSFYLSKTVCVCGAKGALCDCWSIRVLWFRVGGKLDFQGLLIRCQVDILELLARVVLPVTLVVCVVIQSLPYRAAGSGELWITPTLLVLVHVCLKALTQSLFFSQVKGSDGLNTEAIETEVELREHIPEWLPIKGCRARIYYHGMKQQCSNCWMLGHLSKQCKSPKATWKDFVNYLWETEKFEKPMFGHLLEDKPTKPATEEDLKAILESGVDLRKLVNAIKASGAAKGDAAEKKRPIKRGRPKANQTAKKPKTNE